MVNEKSRELRVLLECDVLVCGGGIAGVTAAVAAARNGARVTLLEREYALGGLSNNIFASRYVLYMPDKEQLIAQVEAVLKNWHEEKDCNGNG